MRAFRALLPIAILALDPSSGSAQMYRRVDEGGTVHFKVMLDNAAGRVVLGSK